MFVERLFVLFFVFKWINGIVEVPVVKTEFGAVRGVYEENAHGKFISYMGIPYGRHPPGNVFGDPVDPKPWTKVLEANNENVICPQREEFNKTLVGDIDCLKLNIYLPANITSGDSLPVLYFIYGGAFKYGFAGKYTWGPFKLVRHHIILVLANYRVGPFGFLCLGTKDIPGNAGLKDAHKGLVWVKNNIKRFGGDPNAVTLGGSSSGAMMAEQMIVSPSTDNFFQRVILQSGSLYHSQFNDFLDHKEDVLHMSHYFGYKTTCIDNAVKFLQNITTFELLVASEQLQMKFMYCIEPKMDGVQTFLTDFPARYLEIGNFTPVNIMTGFNTVECPVFTLDKTINEHYENILPTALRLLNAPQKDFEQLTRAAGYFYEGSEVVSDKVEPEVSMFKSDYELTYPILRSADLYRAKVEKVYLYEYGYSGNRNNGQYLHGLTSAYAIHSDELGYLFEQPFWKTPLTANDRLISDRMTTMWTNFIKYGDPTPQLTKLLPVKWHPMGEKSNEYLYINTEMKGLVDPRRERMAFWEMILNRYYKFNYSNEKKLIHP